MSLHLDRLHHTALGGSFDAAELRWWIRMQQQAKCAHCSNSLQPQPTPSWFSVCSAACHVFLGCFPAVKIYSPYHYHNLSSILDLLTSNDKLSCLMFVFLCTNHCTAVSAGRTWSQLSFAFGKCFFFWYCRSKIIFSWKYFWLFPISPLSLSIQAWVKVQSCSRGIERHVSAFALANNKWSCCCPNVV